MNAQQQVIFPKWDSMHLHNYVQSLDVLTLKEQGSVAATSQGSDLCPCNEHM